MPAPAYPLLDKIADPGDLRRLPRADLPVLARQLLTTIAEHSHSEINRLTVLNRDILGLRRDELDEEPTALVANLPYNIAVPALLHLMAEFPSIRTVLVPLVAWSRVALGRHTIRQVISGALVAVVCATAVLRAYGF